LVDDKGSRIPGVEGSSEILDNYKTIIKEQQQIISRHFSSLYPPLVGLRGDCNISSPLRGGLRWGLLSFYAPAFSF
jgi:hypothetical protein